MNAAFLALFALIVLVAGLAMLMARRTARADDSLRLPDMMRLRGAMPLEPLTGAAVHDAANAERRCLACGAKSVCSEFISEGRSDGYALFCPNAHYIEQIRSRLL